MIKIGPFVLARAEDLSAKNWRIDRLRDDRDEWKSRALSAEKDAACIHDLRTRLDIRAGTIEAARRELVSLRVALSKSYDQLFGDDES